MSADSADEVTAEIGPGAASRLSLIWSCDCHLSPSDSAAAAVTSFLLFSLLPSALLFFLPSPPSLLSLYERLPAASRVLECESAVSPSTLQGAFPFSTAACPCWCSCSAVNMAAFVRVSGPPNGNFLIGYPGISATMVSFQEPGCPPEVGIAGPYRSLTPPDPSLVLKARSRSDLVSGSQPLLMSPSLLSPSTVANQYTRLPIP